MPCVRLTLQYDGTDFAGSQMQPGQRTVQGELESALRRIDRGPAGTVFAGRTDRGVHAIGQVAKCSLPNWRQDCRAFQRALAAMLPPDLGTMAVEQCRDSFHPRFDAAWREYRYSIALGDAGPFLRRYAHELRSEVSVAAFAEATAKLVGTHDFASFAGGGEGVPWSERARRPRGTTRTVYCCECRKSTAGFGPAGGQAVRILEFRVVADAFLPRMVRTMVGAVIEVGQGRREAGWIDTLLMAADRRSGAAVAPANGLCLWRVGYDDDLWEEW